MMVGMMAYRPVQALMGYRDGEALYHVVSMLQESLCLCVMCSYILLNSWRHTSLSSFQQTDW